MDKSTKIIIKGGAGMINLTNKIWKKKFSQLVKDGKLQKDFGEDFLAKLESKVKKSQKKYDAFIKIISKPKKKKKSKKQQNTVSNKAIVEFTLETFGKTNKLWAKGFKKLIKEEKLSQEDGNNFLVNIDKSVKEYWEAYLKDMGTTITEALGKKTKKEEDNPQKKAFDSILGMIAVAKDSWKKKQKQAKDNSQRQTEEPKTSNKKTTEQSESSEIREKRIQNLELKVNLLLQEIGIIKKTCKENTAKEVPNQKPTAKKAAAPETVKNEKVIETKAIPNPKKDDFKKIEGIGPKIEAVLHNAGILSFTQLSAAKAEAVKTILTTAGNRFKMHNPTTWGQQAALAAKGNWEALKKWQDELKGGK